MKIIYTKRVKLLHVAFMLLAITVHLDAQVTIGSSSSPPAGAILQLKNIEGGANGVTADRGLALPRVKLTDPNNLYPMFLESDGVTPTSEYMANKSNIDLSHTGLLVFHTENCSMNGKGVYVWAKDVWRKMGNVEHPGVKLNTSETIIHLPSGRDLRPLDPSNPPILEVTVGPDGATAVISESATSTLDLVPFTKYPLLSPLPSSTTKLSLLPDSMNITTEVTTTDPWFSKESKLTFTTECGTTDIILNQTNYAAILGNSVRDTMITFHGINQAHGLHVKSNVRWVANFTDPEGILLSYTPANGIINGVDKYDGTINGGIGLRVEAKPGGIGLRFKEARAIVSDPNIPKRYQDINMIFKQCQGTEDLTVLASYPYDTDYGPNKVRKHKDSRGPSGDYDFYSADFGTAGRWMITNMSAITYDPIRTDGSSNPSINMHNDYNPTQDIDWASWGYPNKSGSTDATDTDIYVNNPHYGLLYTWAAATGGRIASTPSEFNQKYVEEGGIQVKVQGICPNGWHLPSDWEWTRLENEIINNTTKYSEYTENIIDMPGGETFDGTQAWGYRGILHGAAMKDACEQIAANTDLSNYGKSKRIVDGGFSGLLAGYASPAVAVGKSHNYGHIGSFMSSSSTSVDKDARRTLRTGKDVGIVSLSDKYQMSSVRCVKDWF